MSQFMHNLTGTTVNDFLMPPLLITFLVYLLLILFRLGVKAYKRTHSLGDYILGGRKLGSVVTALSVGASDMRVAGFY